MSRFLKNALATFDSFGKALSEIDKTFTTFTNENKVFNDIANRSKDLFSDFGSFIKEVHETMSDLKIEVPYNKETDTIQFTTEGGTFKVEVKSNDGSRQNSVSTTIPSNCEVDKLVQKYDENKKIIAFIIPKKKDIKEIKNEKIQKLIKAYEDTHNELRKQLKNEILKIKADAENKEKTPNEETKKPKRDAKGRFTAKVKNGKIKVESK